MNLADRLAARGMSASAVAQAVRMWDAYAPHLAATDGGGASDIDRARTAWDALVASRAWTRQYATRSRTSLVRALETARPELAPALLCKAPPGRRKRVLTSSSHENEFFLHDCLPRAVRALPTHALKYGLMTHVAERLVEVARSVCRRSLQKRLGFVEHLLFDAPPMLSSDCGTLCDALDALRRVPAAAWLQRLNVVYPDGARLGPKLFRSHLAVVSALHAAVFKCDDHATPIPRTAGVSVCIDSDAGNGSTSFASSDDDPAAHGTWRLQREVGALQARLCKRPRREAADDAPTAFSPEEVLRILSAAQTTPERLVTLLLLTTGVRIGGLCRIRCRGRAEWAREIPADALCTVEKGNVPRTLQVNGAVRVLLARWFRECRPADGPFLFPAPGDAARPLSTSSAWRTVKDVLRRADVRGAHAHPHTFRHTFVPCHCLGE